MKIRADIALVRQQLVSSREQGQRCIMAGLVHSDNDLIDKPGQMIDESIKLYLKKPLIPYVSRGGVKLAGAIKTFNVDFSEKTVLDIGSSTGGFTDCALQHGAKKVYAVDVTNHLDYKLTSNPNVISLSGENFRYLAKDKINEEIDIVVIDVSFISLYHIFSNLVNFTNSEQQVIALIKPQFEAGKGEVGKKGVVRDGAILIKAIKDVIKYARQFNFMVKSVTHSPIRGKKEGNIEFFIHLGRIGADCDINVDIIVENAYNYFKEKGKDEC